MKIREAPRPPHPAPYGVKKGKPLTNLQYVDRVVRTPFHIATLNAKGKAGGHKTLKDAKGSVGSLGLMPKYEPNSLDFAKRIVRNGNILGDFVKYGSPLQSSSHIDRQLMAIMQSLKIDLKHPGRANVLNGILRRVANKGQTYYNNINRRNPYTGTGGNQEY